MSKYKSSSLISKTNASSSLSIVYGLRINVTTQCEGMISIKIILERTEGNNQVFYIKSVSPASIGFGQIVSLRSISHLKGVHQDNAQTHQRYNMLTVCNRLPYFLQNEIAIAEWKEQICFLPEPYFEVIIQYRFFTLNPYFPPKP